jgi:ABC-type nickel/cobalt efflux system permease component RcnA
MSRYLFVAVIWAMIASTLAGPFAAFAQSTAGAGLNEQQAQPKIDRRKLIVPPRNPDGSLITTPFFADPMEWLREKQRAFYGALSGAMRSIKSDAPVAAASMLILLSFGYGIFHAAGPGHGKAVISTWLVATENELRRGILIAFMSAGVQALTAIAIVTVLLLIVSAVGSAARNVADFLQSASFALIGGMGLWLMWSAFRPHGHATQEVAARHDHHVHGGHHSEDCSCGHAHFPAARNVKGEWSWIKASSLAFAVGIRPCTGAILALIFANAIGLYWAGIASTLVMALGTAITVSIIAAVAVYSKRLALRMAVRERAWLDRLAFGLRVAGGAAIAAFGGLLFWSSLWTTQTVM